MEDLQRLLSNPDLTEKLRKFQQFRDDFKDEKPPLAKPRSRQSQTRLTKPQVDQLVEAYRAGASQQTLAKQFNVHRLTVVSHLQKRGIPLRPSKYVVSETDLHEAIKRYQAGDSLVTVGAHLGIEPKAVGRMLRSAGCELRKRNGWD